MSQKALPIKAETAQIPAEDAVNPTEDAQDETQTEEKHHLLQKLETITDGLTRYIDAINEWMAAKAKPDSEATPENVARGPILVGGWLIILVFGFLGLWSAIAPLASAAIAPGKIILSGNKKTIQHLEGGIVEKIYVREGQAVAAGEPLIRLNETAARARLDLFRKQYQAAIAAEARLLAERDGKESIVFPTELTTSDNIDELKEILESQRRLFDSRRLSIQGKRNLLEQKKLQLKQEIAGLQAQVDSATRQIDLLGEEISAVDKLLKQGNAQRPRLLALQRQQANLEGERGEYKASISRAEQAIAEADIEMLNIENEFANTVAAEMKETVEKIADLQERLKASGDVIDRIIISAPMAGVVTGLKMHTIGGVIAPGNPLMDIVPIDELLVEASVSPKDIDVVRPGLKARVQLTAYKTRNVPPLEAEVLYVSADRVDDPNTGASYYPTRLRISDQELESHKNIELTPGMPADALIVTGERTLLGYLMAPITESFRKAFREE